MAKKFPDLSGDGKTTMKDILIGRGVIKKKKKKKEKTMPVHKDKAMMKRGGMAKKKTMKKKKKRVMKRGGGMMKPKMVQARLGRYWLQEKRWRLCKVRTIQTKERC